jgi:hypothetical protein
MPEEDDTTKKATGWTAEKIVAAITRLAQDKKGEQKKIVICFSEEMPWLAEGHAIDAFLLCSKEEKGFLVPATHREALLPMLQSRCPGTRIFSFDGNHAVMGDAAESPGSQGSLFTEA